MSDPDPRVPERARRWQYPARYKQAIGARPGLKDIRDQGHSPGEDAHLGDRGEEEKAHARRSFATEFKVEIVERCQRGDRSVGQVARDVVLTETAVREWIRQADTLCVKPPALSIGRDPRLTGTASRVGDDNDFEHRHRPSLGTPFLGIRDLLGAYLIVDWG